MKKVLFTICLSIACLVAKSQSNQNEIDLQVLFNAVKKLPSYKDQVSINPKLQFNLSKDFAFSGKESTFEVFLKLYQLIAPIRDNHLAFYTNVDSLYSKPTIFEISKNTVDSAIAAVDSNDKLVGEYYSTTSKINLLKLKNYYAAILEYNGKFYTQFLLSYVTPNHFDLIGFRDNGKKYYIIRNIVFVNGRLSGTPFKKYQRADFVSIPANAPKFEIRKVDDLITYLRLGNFGTSTENIAASVKFYNQIGEIKTPHLIVDLRNNGGGGFKNSGKFLSLIKKYEGKVHLVFNSYTVSNAEQFTIDLMNRDNVTTYGETTCGTICYGSNVDTIVDLPSKRFSFYITDMSARKQDLPFESIGITPKIELNIFEKDWIEQITDMIKSTK